MDLKGTPFYLDDEQLNWVEQTLAGLSLEQKAGQLFCVMGGDYSEGELLELVCRFAVGGVLFRPGLSAQLCERFARLDQAAAVVLLKAANLEEGGSGAISDGMFFGWPMMVAATDDINCMEEFAQVCAAQGGSIGINWTFSPVCDLDINCQNPITNVRTCGSDTPRVRDMCETYVQSVQGKGMAACAKHFPGDGVDYRDQHLHPTYNSLSVDAWEDSYGLIYSSLI